MMPMTTNSSTRVKARRRRYGWACDMIPLFRLGSETRNKLNAGEDEILLKIRSRSSQRMFAALPSPEQTRGMRCDCGTLRRALVDVPKEFGSELFYLITVFKAGDDDLS